MIEDYEQQSLSEYIESIEAKWDADTEKFERERDEQPNDTQ